MIKLMIKLLPHSPLETITNAVNKLATADTIN
jgi:hypothetical protein